jgi:hypothetical protein
MDFSWFKLSGFALFAVIVYLAFIISDWIAKSAGMSSWGAIGTGLVLILPVFIAYFVTKKYLRSSL